MIGAEAAIARGYAAYKQGDLNAARVLLEPVAHHQAWHLLGLVERASGRYAEATAWLDKAYQRDPNNPEISNNQGRVALDAGNLERAETSFRRAIELRPNWVPALTGLAQSLNNQTRWQEADIVWKQILAITPNDRVARYNAAMASLEIGHVEHAEREFDGLIKAGLTDPAVYFMRGRARVEMSELEAGLHDFRLSWDRQKTAHALRNLANTLWMTGDSSGFFDVVSAAPNEFAALKVFLVGKTGDLSRALDIWNALPEPYRSDPETLTAKANIHKLLGEADAALEAASKAHELRPNQDSVDDALVCAQLMVGDYDSALKTIAPWRARQPLEQSWIAHEMLALRLAGDARYAALAQPDTLIRAFELPVPEGFGSIDQFNDALIEAIAPNQSFTHRPLDQTLRSGTQTARDLVHVQNPVIQAYLQALDGPIQEYLNAIGRDSKHPLLSRNTGKYRFNGCWSVTLSGGGHHVNHVHPKGWISSAYYARVPAETDSEDGKAGWIKFGEPPFKTQPELPPEKWVQPKAGTLVLFPSYMWHGTEPIHAGSERITVPFDLVPD